MSSEIVCVIADFKELAFVHFFSVSNYLKGFNQISKTSLLLTLLIYLSLD